MKPAILFLIFNRPEHTRLVFDRIRNYRPERLYIAADGPRAGNSSDIERCHSARAITESIDWDCKVHSLFRDDNLGCKNAVSSAITWFFNLEEEGIILEDDCLPANDFFLFCAELLATYRNDERVQHITGTNLQFGQKRGEASYYFSSLACVWGWAGWRRVWKNYDVDMRQFEAFESERLIDNILPDKEIADWAVKNTRAVYEGKVNTWDYQYAFSILLNNGLCIVPNTNLISNIGFGPDGHLTKNPSDIHSRIKTGEIPEIHHPDFFIPDRDADLYQLSLSMPVTKRLAPAISFAERLTNKLRRSAQKIFHI